MAQLKGRGAGGGGTVRTWAVPPRSGSHKKLVRPLSSRVLSVSLLLPVPSSLCTVLTLSCYTSLTHIIPD